METLPIEYFKLRKYYLFGLNWSRPIESKYINGNLFIGSQSSCTPIFKAVDERKIAANIGVANA